MIMMVSSPDSQAVFRAIPALDDTPGLVTTPHLTGHQVSPSLNISTRALSDSLEARAVDAGSANTG